MDRRRFLATAGALSAHSLLSPSFKAFAQQDPYASLAFSNSVAVGNGCHTVARASDWYALQAAFSSVLSDWMANNRDADVKATAGYVDPSWVSSAGINMAAYAGQFQSYQPAVQVGDLQTAAAYIDMKAPSTVPWVLEVFQSDGMELDPGARRRHVGNHRSHRRNCSVWLGYRPRCQRVQLLKKG